MSKGKIITGYVLTAVLFFFAGWFGQLEYLKYEFTQAFSEAFTASPTPAAEKPSEAPSPANSAAVGNPNPSVGEIFRIGDLRIKTVKVATGVRSEKGTWDTIVTTQGQLIVAHFKAKNAGKAPADISMTGLPNAKLVSSDGAVYEPKGWTMPGDESMNPGVTEDNIRVVWDVAKEVEAKALQIDLDGSVITVQVA
ncbi:DUF4352 domain-containing protein [Planotetraspora sp. A-T 1434]|uniref:DUF4352 domain-containing protein n=1 Tax=Planotetraspora sp. A-T 1434 TaxID=2979219 RepID=UPI0021BF0E54|nr:DUF4352 domain-containing protein [Planotetraspora sp. A-T 1434]MCT9930144.1 DUF4352 domain-containing protein [Planotetraspora sp. A-T 1434]